MRQTERIGYATQVPINEEELLALSLPIILIVLGIIVAVAVSAVIGIIMIVIGLVLLLLPQFRGRTARV